MNPSSVRRRGSDSFLLWRRLSFLILATAIAQVIAFLSLSKSLVILRISPIIESPLFTRQIFIAVFTGARRANVLSVQSQTHSWLLAQPYVAGLCFIGYGPVESEDPLIRRHYVDVELQPNDTSWHFLCSKVYTAVKLFLATPADWLLRICDDGMINPVTFPAFFSELNDFADPATTRVIQGHQVAKPKIRKYVYPQGGSGIVFSRFAAEEIWNKSARFVFVCDHCRNDDRAIGLWMLFHNVSAWNATNRWFVGHQFAGQKGGAVAGIPKLLKTVTACPQRPQTALGIRPYFNRVKDITFWHDRVKFEEFGPRLEKLRRSLPHNLFFAPGGETPILCFGTARTETESRYYE
jgi:hypothetical protein